MYIAGASWSGGRALALLCLWAKSRSLFPCSASPYSSATLLYLSDLYKCCGPLGAHVALYVIVAGRTGVITETSHKTLRDYSKAWLDILKKLGDAQIQHEVKLPHLVAVGAQSAGKSSLLETISTLKLPRGVGTCTKCPMEFRLEQSAASASLSVDIALRVGTENVPFRNNLSDLNEIRSAIADAQKRILNPNPPVRGTAVIPGDSARTFSEDCVCVFAKGPDMPDLYFYDIPGVIHDVGDAQDPTQIELIKKIVKKYVAEDDCIVLLVVSCEYDWEIGGVAPLIFTDSDPKVKLRTVGVLTKVDRIAEDMGPTWLDIFHNKTRKLEKGWFAVKLPAGGDMPWETARQQEREWFQQNALWKSIREEDMNRLGSERLTQYISKQLSSLVAERLPEISREITDIIHGCDRELALLPRHTEQNAQYTVTHSIGKFTRDLLTHIDPGILPKPFTTEAGLIYQVNGLYDAMRDGVSEKTPRFCPSFKPESRPGNSPAWAQLCAKGEIVYLDQVMQYMKRSSRNMRLLPGELPYRIVPHIITDFVGSWGDIVISGFERVRAEAIEHLNALVQTHFAEYEQGGLLELIQTILNENIGHCGDDTVVELDRLAARELAPSTVLRAEYSVLQTRIREQYQHALTPDAAPESLWSAAADLVGAILVKNSTTIVGELTAGAISAATRQSIIDQLARSGQRDGTATLNGATVDKDLNNALEVMSSVQAYLELASKRFADVATNCIDHSFLRTLYERVDSALRALPCNNSPEMCLELIQDPTIVEHRRSLKERRNHFAGVKNMLKDAMRDLERENADPHFSTASESTQPGPQPQSNSVAPSSVDTSSSSLAEIDVADSEKSYWNMNSGEVVENGIPVALDQEKAYYRSLQPLLQKIDFSPESRNWPTRLRNCTATVCGSWCFVRVKMSKERERKYGTMRGKYCLARLGWGRLEKEREK
ncbi:P-loop containing nucleoside triphosphate hydrolase protein [Mycena galopus ATCC 62051]|nr:P-loop containing nucleoside triphosphate hydrolase protein [Mycena galopus ATCC 62051]